ncbi:hypothetical protein ISN44_As03g027080 [Arabidopsis suecica]|uniref:Uncharacterized protein n=1 Tax=Arabidopsis suecica TaxID=45249 RepID=A0A8T2F8U9_ARASU|nr:hypothetical protein ISN44_As03g027080 [Arabidopsis suecica]
MRNNCLQKNPPEIYNFDHTSLSSPQHQNHYVNKTFFSNTNTQNCICFYL